MSSHHRIEEMRSAIAQPTYDLLDFGAGARLERFGHLTVERPHPAAIGVPRQPGAWRQADLRFDSAGGWRGPAVGQRSWSMAVSGLTLELRTTDTGQVGLFSEQLAMLPWLRDQVGGRTPATVLNLFAYTGLATLALAHAGAAVTHVDAARPNVAWARSNAERSGLGTQPIRWIVDDATAFTRREVRRGRRYDGLVLDPPTYGHGPRGRSWELERDLPALLALAGELLQPRAFVLLTAHTPGVDGERLAGLLAEQRRLDRRSVERGDLAVSTAEGRALRLGAFARWPAGAS